MPSGGGAAVGGWAIKEDLQGTGTYSVDIVPPAGTVGNFNIKVSIVGEPTPYIFIYVEV